MEPINPYAPRRAEIAVLIAALPSAITGNATHEALQAVPTQRPVAHVYSRSVGKLV